MSDEGGLVGSDDEGRGEEEVVAAGAVDAALNGVSEHAFVRGCGADFFGDGLCGIERSASGFVADEFDAKEKAKAANFADVAMSGEGREGGAESFCGGRDACEETVRFDVVENGIAGGGGDRVGLIGETVFEDARAAFEGFDDVA